MPYSKYIYRALLAFSIILKEVPSTLFDFTWSALERMAIFLQCPHPSTLSPMNRDVKYQYNANCRILREETEEDINTWKAILCSRIERVNIVKMSTLPTAIEIQCTLYQNPHPIFNRTRKNDLKMCKKPHKTPIAPKNSGEKRKLVVLYSRLTD